MAATYIPTSAMPTTQTINSHFGVGVGGRTLIPMCSPGVLSCQARRKIANAGAAPLIIRGSGTAPPGGSRSSAQHSAKHLSQLLPDRRIYVLQLA